MILLDVAGLPKNVVIGQTQRQSLQSVPAHEKSLDGFNLALHVNDNALRVQTHRIQLLEQLKVNQLTWLTQIHSTVCHEVNEDIFFAPLEGDALVTQQKNHALMMMTADCLPIVLVNAQGTEVANLHAGWRGLADGIIENTLNKMHSQAVFAWLGACISQSCFEVGAEVKAIFCKKYAVDFAFKEGQNNKYHANLYQIARFILHQHGVTQVLGGDACTYTQTQDYFSYRRNAKTGRMATFVFMK